MNSLIWPNLRFPVTDKTYLLIPCRYFGFFLVLLLRVFRERSGQPGGSFGVFRAVLTAFRGCSRVFRAYSWFYGHPHIHVHNFSKKLICIKKGLTLDFVRKTSPKYANAAEMVNTMSVASLFRHVERRSKSLCNRFCIYVSVLQYELSFTLFSLVRRLLNMTGK